MKFDVLERIIVDFLQEQEAKIGYMKGEMRVYYFLSSLKRYAKIDGGIEEMKEYLGKFTEFVKERFGNIRVMNEGERFCLVIPAEGAEYIHNLPVQDEFLPELLKVVSVHGCTYEKLLDTFHKYSSHVHTETIHTEDFDYLIYFEDGIPNDYRYCFKDEGHHMIYHRFTPGDYEDLFA